MTQEGSEVFKVRAKDDRTGRTELFDLLRDKFVSVRHVMKDEKRSRGVDTESMFENILAAYTHLKTELEQSPGLAYENE